MCFPHHLIPLHMAGREEALQRYRALHDRGTEGAEMPEYFRAEGPLVALTLAFHYAVHRAEPGAHPDASCGRFDKVGPAWDSETEEGTRDVLFTLRWALPEPREESCVVEGVPYPVAATMILNLAAGVSPTTSESFSVASGEHERESSGSQREGCEASEAMQCDEEGRLTRKRLLEHQERAGYRPQRAREWVRRLDVPQQRGLVESQAAEFMDRPSA
eukprot:m51a1_g7947 hypothetical protein (217) ;mRNA; f:149160-149996